MPPVLRIPIILTVQYLIAVPGPANLGVYFCGLPDHCLRPDLSYSRLVPDNELWVDTEKAHHKAVKQRSISGRWVSTTDVPVHTSDW